MANKIPWYVTIEWKNVSGIIVTIVIIAVVIFFVFLPRVVQNNKIEKYKGETTGTLTNITENTEMNQGRGGTSIYIGSYSVDYYYTVNGQTYNGTERVKATPKSSTFLNSITKGEPSQLIIRYDESNAKKSTILVQ